MLVGEQPGDKEDLAGKPFIGPAGRMLDRALQDAGIAREETFVTTIGKARGKGLSLEDGTKLFITVHPSSLLRIENEDDKRTAYRQFVADLRRAAAALAVSRGR